MRLILIRHAESEHSVRGLIANGPSCPGLTERGFRQAERLADRLQESGEMRECIALLSSPALRARQTAEAVKRRLFPGAIREERGLCEVEPGVAEGLSWEAYRARYGEFDLLASPTRPFAPGGESWQSFLVRSRATLEGLAQQYAGQKVVAVTHAGFIVASLLVLFDIPRPGTGARLEPLHTALTEWEHAQGRWCLLRFNDAIHLSSPIRLRAGKEPDAP